MRVTIFERDGPEDTSGWGVVFSERTLAFLEDEEGAEVRRIYRIEPERVSTWGPFG